MMLVPVVMLAGASAFGTMIRNVFQTRLTAFECKAYINADVAHNASFDVTSQTRRPKRRGAGDQRHRHRVDSEKKGRSLTVQ
jgi:hypothetical protein